MARHLDSEGRRII